jgi:hypothetical protein
MASNEAMFHRQTQRHHTWQTLIELDLSGEPGSERLAVERVAQAMHWLNWPAVQLRQLNLALAQAARKAAGCSCRYDTGGTLTIRVLIPENDPTTRETDLAYSKSTPPPAPQVEAQETTHYPSRGWGFFMIEKTVPSSDGRDVRYLIELYLYPEGAKRDTNSV